MSLRRGEEQMKTFILCLLCLSLQATGYCQNDKGQEVIEKIIKTGAIEGNDIKIIGPMGDAAAVTLTKILGNKELLSNDIDAALWVIGHAFADPTFVKSIPDRQPRTALLVLNY